MIKPLLYFILFFVFFIWIIILMNVIIYAESKYERPGLIVIPFLIISGLLTIILVK